MGSLDVNGTLRPFAPLPGSGSYVGCDVAAGPGVNVVLKDPYHLPWPDGTFDLVVSTSCLEHDEFFWLSFVEMARVVRPGGYVYLSAPVGGVVHRHPVDCWRFYPDAGIALERWSTREGWALKLIESFVRPPGREGWADFVAVFGKPAVRFPDRYLSDRFPNAQHRRP